jgi:Protein of unknown function DUF262
MKREIEQWPATLLRERYLEIDFPEYQREPSLWSRIEKQRLIDSMLRDFDIASLYLSPTEANTFDCIDGRQRITAIMAFIGDAKSDPDNGFPLSLTNEIIKEEQNKFQALNGRTFESLRADVEGSLAQEAVEKLLNYSVTVVLLSDTHETGEFNLQFTRLNLGVIVNAGEKLNAMVGEMRDACFAKDSRVGHHPFLASVSVPKRRFAREVLAASILAQIFEQKQRQQFARTRHFDLQRFFKEHSTVDPVRTEWIHEAVEAMDWLERCEADVKALLRSRAMVVSIVLLVWMLRLHLTNENETFSRFLAEFSCRLSWQVRMGIDSDEEYRFLIEFQRHVTQASVERPAVEARHRTLAEEFKRWRETGKIRGDAEFGRRSGGQDPGRLCRSEGT